MKHYIGAKFPEVVSHKDLNHYSMCCMSSLHFYMCQSQKMRQSFFASQFIGYGRVMSQDVSRVNGWSRRRMVGGNDIKRRVLGVRPVSMIPSGAFLPLPFGPIRRMFGPLSQLNSHGNYLLRTYSGRTFEVSDYDQFIYCTILQSNTLK